MRFINDNQRKAVFARMQNRFSEDQRKPIIIKSGGSVAMFKPEFLDEMSKPVQRIEKKNIDLVAMIRAEGKEPDDMNKMIEKARKDKFSLKEDIKKMVAIGEFRLDPEARALVDALDDAEMVGGDDGVKEQVLHITSALVPSNIEQEEIVNRLTSMAYDKPYVVEKGALPASEEQQSIQSNEGFVPSVAYPLAGLTVFSAAPRANPFNDGLDLTEVDLLEKQLNTTIRKQKKEMKKTELMDDVLGAIDNTYKTGEMDPDERHNLTLKAVHNVLDSRLSGDRIVKKKDEK